LCFLEVRIPLEPLDLLHLLAIATVKKARLGEMDKVRHTIPMMARHFPLYSHGMPTSPVRVFRFQCCAIMRQLLGSVIRENGEGKDAMGKRYLFRSTLVSS
jgi:hypothetical protein